MLRKGGMKKQEITTPNWTSLSLTGIEPVFSP